MRTFLAISLFGLLSSVSAAVVRRQDSLPDCAAACDVDLTCISDDFATCVANAGCSDTDAADAIAFGDGVCAGSITESPADSSAASETATVTDTFTDDTSTAVTTATTSAATTSASTTATTTRATTTSTTSHSSSTVKASTTGTSASTSATTGTSAGIAVRLVSGQAAAAILGSLVISVLGAVIAI